MSKKEFSRMECTKWAIGDKTRNPKTGRKIKPNSRTAKTLNRLCKVYDIAVQRRSVKVETGVALKKGEFTQMECLRWLNNRKQNPRTKRMIKPNGPTAKKLDRLCKVYGLKKQTSMSPRKYKTENIKFMFK